MRLQLALRYAAEVARRVHAINGLLATPVCDAEAVRIRRIYVFGSTVKGSQNPNDLDLLIDLQRCGRHRTWEQTKKDKEYYRRHGIKVAPCAEIEALKWLTKGMRNVSRHIASREAIPIDTKVEIYPRWLINPSKSRGGA